MEKNVLKNDKKQIDSDIIDEYMLSTIKSIKEGIFLLKSQNRFKYKISKSFKRILHILKI
jgi:hypothetical protein